MGSDSSVAITAGSGTAVDTFALSGGDHQQVVRPAWATAESETFWAGSTTASASVVAADVNRLSMLLTNRTPGRIYLRFDSTVPTAATNGSHWFLETDERWEVPDPFARLAVSMLATIAGGHVVALLGTAS